MNSTTMDDTTPALPEDAASGRSDSDELQRRLAGYGVSALAITGALAASAVPASAQIVATTLNPPLTIYPSELPQAIVFDFNTMTAHYGFSGSGSAPGKFALENVSFGGGTFEGATRLAAIQPVAGAVFDYGSGDLFAYKYARGASIAPGLTYAGPFGYLFAQGATFNDGPFAPGSSTNRGLVGLVFPLGSTNPNGYFGWADIGVNSDAGLTLYAFGYNATNSTGGPFADPVPAGAGEAPDASPLALLLLGGFAGMAAYRVQAGRRTKHDGAVALN